jgi:hypothetical protein
MWQPKQPASEVVARRTFRFSITALISSLDFRSTFRQLSYLLANGFLVVQTLANRHGKALALFKDDADRTNVRGAISQREIRIRQSA